MQSGFLTSLMAYLPNLCLSPLNIPDTAIDMMQASSLVLVLPLFTTSSFSQNCTEEEPPKYAVCPNELHSLPFCCTNLFLGIGLGCRQRGSP